MKLASIANWASLLFAGLVIGCSILIAYWATSGETAVTIKNQFSLEAKQKTVRAGDYVTLVVDFCKHTDAHGRVVRRIASDKTELLAPVETDKAPKGCYHNVPIAVPIPPQATAGTYRVYYRSTYKTNPLHSNVVVEAKSKPFQVIK